MKIQFQNFQLQEYEINSNATTWTGLFDSTHPLFFMGISSLNTLVSLTTFLYALSLAVRNLGSSLKASCTRALNLLNNSNNCSTYFSESCIGKAKQTCYIRAWFQYFQTGEMSGNLRLPGGFHSYPPESVCKQIN